MIPQRWRSAWVVPVCVLLGLVGGLLLRSPSSEVSKSGIQPGSEANKASGQDVSKPVPENRKDAQGKVLPETNAEPPVAAKDPLVEAQERWARKVKLEHDLSAVEELLRRAREKQRSRMLSLDETRKASSILGLPRKLIAANDELVSNYHRRMRAFKELEKFLPKSLEQGGVTGAMQELWRNCVSSTLVAPPGSSSGFRWQGEQYFEKFESKIASGTMLEGDLEELRASVSWFSDFEATLNARKECLGRLLAEISKSSDRRLANTIKPFERDWLSERRGRTVPITHDAFAGRAPEGIPRGDNISSLDDKADPSRYARITGERRSYDNSPEEFIQYLPSDAPIPFFVQVDNQWVGLVEFKNQATGVFEAPWQVTRASATFVVYLAGREGSTIQLVSVQGAACEVAKDKPLVVANGRYYFHSDNNRFYVRSSFVIFEVGLTPEKVVAFLGNGSQN